MSDCSTMPKLMKRKKRLSKPNVSRSIPDAVDLEPTALDDVIFPTMMCSAVRSYIYTLLSGSLSPLTNFLISLSGILYQCYMRA